jgi:cysteinyl-tRNA synthetase
LGLRIYNTLTRQKESFVPLVPGQVHMYVCGITPYDVSHIGHARSALVFDVVARYLAHAGYRVTFVKNYTDVDDTIITRANQHKAPFAELTARSIEAYAADMTRLGVRPPTGAPRATAHIPEMVALIEQLVAKGLAYVVGGDVYFEVGCFPTYGRLSGKNLEELLAGARIDVNERKKDPRDFALWKAAKPGEPSWPSPWGPGRPGWHVECSAMAMKYLGETIDLHGGGEDLIFPHHSCEIAQSEGATGKPFARYWVHNGFVNLGSEKMSKSLGNTLTVEALLGRHDPEALRLYLHQTQ